MVSRHRLQVGVASRLVGVAGRLTDRLTGRQAGGGRARSSTLEEKSCVSDDDEKEEDDEEVCSRRCRTTRQAASQHHTPSITFRLQQNEKSNESYLD